MGVGTQIKSGKKIENYRDFVGDGEKNKIYSLIGETLNNIMFPRK
jgi:hypothetical protein